MDFESMKMHIYDMQEDEQFYKKYYFARQQQYSLELFLSQLNMKDVLKRNLIVLEKPETMPEFFDDSFFFDMSNEESIVIQRHNRYSPSFIHKHTFFELIYVYDGKCTHEVSGKRLEMHTGDLCVIPPEISHTIECFNDDTLIFNVLIRKDTLHTIFRNFLSTNNALASFFLNNIYAKNANDFIIFHTGYDKVIKEAFLRMLWEYQNKERYYFQAISSTLMLCFYLLIRDYEDSIQVPEFAHRLDVQRYAEIKYIQDNYKNVTLNALADKFHYTPEYASKIIKKATNMTYSEIILRVRIEKAQELLLNTNLSVSSIAEEIGYETTEHFIRQFKKNTKTTPAAYRKEHADLVPH